MLRDLLERPAFLLQSSVGDGPIGRLVKHVRARGASAELTQWFGGQEWRLLMRRGRFGRMRARLETYLGFPVVGVAMAAVRQPVVLVPTTNPFPLPFAAVVSRVVHGRPVVAAVYDMYPDAIEAVGLASASSPVARIAAAMNRVWFRHADGLVFIGQKMAENAIARYGEPRAWRVIEIGCDTSDFAAEKLGDPAPASELEAWAEGRTLVSYVGNLGLLHDWETLADAVPTLLATLAKETTRPLGIVVAAFGPGLESIKARWATLDDERVRFVDPLDDAAWARLMARTDVSIITLRPEARHACVPSKALSAMAATSAVVAVAPRDSDLARLVDKHVCGAVVEPGDAPGLAQVLGSLLADDVKRERLKRNAFVAARDVFDMPVIAERWIEFLDEIGIDVRRPGRSRPGRVYRWAKRSVDLAGAGVALIATAPIMVGAAVAVRITMGSPVLFTQKRAGREGERLTLFKFRTMRHPEPGEEGPESDAARLTRVGRLLRSTSVDELPAVFNVLRGEMSLVGPRPLLERYLPRYDDQQARRHEVTPGITGWAQVNGRNAIAWEEKFDLDVWYVDHRSLTLDLWILVLTVLKVVQRKDISHDGHVSMPEFMGSSREVS